jgi:hypothetical protein
MSNVFRNKMPIEKPNRNTFDLSFANNLTMKFGALYPVFCKEVIPGDSFHIKADFGLRFMPMVFPVQTRMKAYLHFFYVRNRNLWTNWKKFITATDSSVNFPYIDASSTNGKSLFVTGSLGDYLGLPTTLVSGSGSSPSIKVMPLSSLSTIGVNTLKASAVILDLNLFIWKNVYRSSYGSYLDSGGAVHGINDTELWNTTSQADFGSTSGAGNNSISSKTPPTLDKLVSSFLNQADGDVISCFMNQDLMVYNVVDGTQVTVSNLNGIGSVRLSFWLKERNKEFCYYSSTESKLVNASTSTSVSFDLPDNLRNAAKTYAASIGYSKAGSSTLQLYMSVDVVNSAMFSTPYADERAVVSAFPVIFSSLSGVSATITGTGYASNSTNAQTYINNLYKNLNISALPFRAYESIYNSFYRNILNDPFVINGVAEYDKFIENDSDGADSSLYQLRYKNWEDDFLTMSVPSPQQGIAPLLGMSYGGSSFSKSILRITHGEDQDQSNMDYVKVNVDSSKNVTFTEVLTANTNEHVQGFLDLLKDASSFGISINDLRNVNSLQRWLEKNSARGFRYKEQIMSHFGVDLSFELCDMPEFIGGFTKDVNIQTVTQTSEGSSPLGSYAGQGYCIGSTENSINRYCDEHGFIMGILSVVPIPSYSQNLPKMFLKKEHLNYFSPEFAHISYQPVQYKEVCPIQKFYDSNSDATKLDQVFGYQRPWYDYLASTDEVHGGFRNDDLKNFLVNRTFAVSPELSANFLHVSPDEVNDIFAVTTDNDDKILGQVYFDVKAKRPIPEFVTPSIQ